MQPVPTTDAFAQAAVADVRSGMVVGLGTGRTSDRATRALAQRMREDHLDIDCVCTSNATEKLALELGLPVIPFGEVEQVDHLFDGASEVDHDLRMLKGQFGAIARQRLVAQVARHRVYMVGEDKVVNKLGTNALLTITIIAFGVASIRNRLRDLGLSGIVRRNLDGEVFLTDGGNLVLDMSLPDRDLADLANELDHVAGIVDHGIFLDEADEVLVECKNGDVRRLVRPG